MIEKNEKSERSEAQPRRPRRRRRVGGPVGAGGGTPAARSGSQRRGAGGPRPGAAEARRRREWAASTLRKQAEGGAELRMRWWACDVEENSSR